VAGTWRGLCGVYSGPAADGEDDVEPLPARYKVLIRPRQGQSSSHTQVLLAYFAFSRLITDTDSSSFIFVMSLPQPRRIIDTALPLYPLPNGLSANAGFVQKSFIAKPDEAAGGAEAKAEGGMFQPGGVTLSWIGESGSAPRVRFSTGSLDHSSQVFS
jgi:hypothetical protein